MMSVMMITPRELAERIAKQAQAKRLALNLTQKTVAERSGVSYGVLKKFERSGQISLASLLKLALVLDSLGEFRDLFFHNKPEHLISLDALMKDKPRKRSRQ